MLKLKFPHIPRKISARLFSYAEKIGLWSILSTLILANLFAKVNLTPDYWNEIVTALQNPISLNAHVVLAETLWKSGFSSRAKKELVYATSLKSSPPSNSAVLGASTVDPEIILNNWLSERSGLEAKYNYWQNVVSQKPDFRDAYLQLATLSYRLGKIAEGKSYLTQLINLDPNFVLNKKLIALYSN